MIKILHHGQRGAGELQILIGAQGAAEGNGTPAEPLPLGVRNGQGRVWRVERDEAEEGGRGGLRAGVIDESQGMVGDAIGDVAVVAEEFAIEFQQRIEVGSPVPLREADERGKAAGPGMVGPLRAVVPLAKTAGRIASTLKHIRHGALVCRHPFQSQRHPPHATARMVAAGEKFGPRRRADRLHKESGERGPAPGQ